ncbi:MAG: hypothetical protein HY887_04010 [Deltaproteobacteria bacterium]|nr:hypothetical protein [Deltaproteobacteria bacterium]
MVIVIVGIIGAGILMFFAGTGSSSSPVLITQGAIIAQEKLERIIADKKAGNFNSIVSEAAVAMPSPFDRFTRETEVFCVQEADLNTSNGTMPNCADSGILAKRVRVIVSWPGGSTELITVLVNH